MKKTWTRTGPCESIILSVIPLPCHTSIQMRKPVELTMRNCMSLVKFLFFSWKQKALKFYDKTEARLQIRRQAVDVICFFM